MEINFKLFVQMGNFAIAYCLIRYLFFKPALVLLDTRDQQLLTDKTKLQEHEFNLVEQRQQVEQAWQQCRAYFEHNIPIIVTNESSLFRDISPTFRPELVSEVQCAQKQQELERAFIKKVSHVRS